MASRRSTYFFPDEYWYQKAKDQLYDLLYQDYQDSDKLYFEGWYGGEYVISVMEYCSNPVLAASICQENHGERKYYPFK